MNEEEDFETIYDEETGTTYLLDPNRKILGQENGETESRNPCGNYTDWSGDVEIIIWQASSRYSQHNNVVCRVGADFVCIGGGARINDDEPGALLTQNSPYGTSGTGWTGASKDHIKECKHYLAVYAIGLRLRNVSRARLMNNMYFGWLTTNKKPHPGAYLGVPPGFRVIGGGARVNYSGEGNMLVCSYYAGYRWGVCAKDHIKSCPATITGYVIGIRDYISPFGYLDIGHTGHKRT